MKHHGEQPPDSLPQNVFTSTRTDGLRRSVAPFLLTAVVIYYALSRSNLLWLIPAGLFFLTGLTVLRKVFHPGRLAWNDKGFEVQRGRKRRQFEWSACSGFHIWNSLGNRYIVFHDVSETPSPFAVRRGDRRSARGNVLLPETYGMDRNELVTFLVSKSKKTSH